MALFIDGPASSIEDLTAQDSQLLDVASGEGIDVSRKLLLAMDEIALELATILAVRSYADSAIWAFPGPAPIENVVVTPALKLWHTFRSLEMVYTDAYNNQLNDRYKGKRDQFQARAKWAYEKLVEIGIGMAWDPIPQAVTPDVATAPGSGLPSGTYYVTMAWVNRGGEEGASAAPASIDIAGSTLLVRPGRAPARAAGWNIFVGTSPDTLGLQNLTPIPAEEPWLQAGPLTAGEQTPTGGQSPSYIVPVVQVIQRG